jgi:filamentous hemagglutinin
LSSSNPLSILADVRKANDTGSKYGIKDATMYVDAPNMTAAQVSNFASNGPLTGTALQQGVIDTVIVKTSTGYITIKNGNVTSGLPQGWKK